VKPGTPAGAGTASGVGSEVTSGLDSGLEDDAVPGRAPAAAYGAAAAGGDDGDDGGDDDGGQDEDLKLALRLADIADGLSMAGFEGNRGWRRKADGSPVTETDQAVEDALTAEIRRRRPGDQVHGEETAGADAPPPGRCWVIDPIDQTRHFVRGNPEFATLIALTGADGEGRLAVVSAPALGLRWWGVAGGGAWKNGAPIGVSEVDDLGDAYLSVAGAHHWPPRRWQSLVGLSRDCAYPAGSPGGFLYPLMVAEGTLDVFVEPWGELWDHLAPAIILRAAGGAATTVAGHAPRGGSLLATNGRLHAAVLRRLTDPSDPSDPIHSPEKE
jgi:histidinol-phosphatase